MCGIVGIYHYGSTLAEPLSVETGLRMTDSLAHRGPDDGGLLVTDRLLLGHRRLSIIDLSEAGHQPMSDDSGRYWIAFNGEIYNFRELRRELESAGHSFRSHTDTEVILRGYIEWGRDVAPRLNGMFAIAIWDQLDQLLWLVRDPVGIKPLFYRNDGSRLWFASEIKGILADDEIERRPDPVGLDQFLTFGYTPAPRTGFAGIQQLMPGESLTGHRGRVVRETWSEWPYPRSPQSATFAECVERLETALDAAVKRQMMSDVPLGALLSGGLDSSAVVRAMRRSGVNEIDTFTISFSDKSFDEAPWAKRVAQRYQTRHHVEQAADEVVGILRTVVAHAEEPFADNSMLPFYMLCEVTRRHVTVALSGDGADELLAGYMTYRANEWAPTYRKLPGFVRQGIIEPLVARMPASRRKYGAASLARRFVAAAALPYPQSHCSWRRIVPAALRETLYTTEYRRQLGADPLHTYADALHDAPEWLSPLEQQLHLDLRFHLPNDMLVKVDRMSMAHSLEVRVPFLDLEVVAACLAMPPACRYRRGQGKRPLRAMLEKDLDADLVQRKKGGFLSPIETWLQGPWQPILQAVLSRDFAEQTGMFDHLILKQMCTDHGAGRGDYAYPLFALLVLGIWWETWIARSASPEPRQPAAAPTQIQRLPHSEVAS